MLISINMLWNVRMRIEKKKASIGLFSLSIITIVLAIIRSNNILSQGSIQATSGTSFVWVWSGVQTPLGASYTPSIRLTNVRLAVSDLSLVSLWRSDHYRLKPLRLPTTFHGVRQYQASMDTHRDLLSELQIANEENEAQQPNV